MHLQTLVLENIPVHYGSLCFGLDRVRNLHLDDTGLDELALSRVAMSTNLETLSLARTLVTCE